MTNKEYMVTQVKMIEIGKVLDTLDFEGFVERCRMAEAIGPVIDPTLYQRAIDNLEAVKNYANKLNHAKYAFKKVFEAVLSTSVREHEIAIRNHDPKCDVDPETNRWKRSIPAGETATVCGYCIKRTRARPPLNIEGDGKVVGYLGNVNGPGCDPDTV